MTLVDTNVLIDILKGNDRAVAESEALPTPHAVSSISAMELFYGARDKAEQRQIERFLALFDVVHMNEDISLKALALVKRYAKSHGLDIPDSLIAATAIVNDCALKTYNRKDFKFISELVLV